MRLQLPTNRVTINIVAYETGVPGLAWHGVKRSYSITHVKSGYAVMTGIRSQSGVQAAIKWLKSLPIDWTESLSKLSPIWV